MDLVKDPWIVQDRIRIEACCRLSAAAPADPTGDEHRAVRTFVASGRPTVQALLAIDFTRLAGVRW
jgi:hypothetical protein